MNNIETIFGFAIFIALFLIVGALASRKSGGSKVDYLLGGRSQNKYVVGLSAGAVAASGFIMVGAVGAGYTMGLSAVLFPLSWLLGDLIFWKFFPKRLYLTANHYNCFTIPELLSAKTEDKSVLPIRKIAGMLVVVLVGLYATAQLLAAGKTVSGAFEVDLTWGIVISITIILLYSAKAGLQASIIINAIQGIIMLVTSITMLVLLIVMGGGVDVLFEKIQSIDPQLVSITGGMAPVVVLGLILGWSATALGFDLSTPQFLVRLLAGKSEEEASASKWVYLSFMQITWISMSLFGTALVVFLPELSDPEQGLAKFASQYLSPTLVGFVLGAIFSAIASTLDSQLLVISSALSEDLFPDYFERQFRRFGSIVQTAVPVLVAVCLVMLSLNTGSTVFTLILASAAILAGAFAPTMLVVILDWKTNTKALKACMVSGALTSIIWRTLGFSEYMLEALPGLVVGLLVHRVVMNFNQKNINK